MKINIWMVVAAAIIVVAMFIIMNASKAQCAWCPDIACFGAGGCPGDCVCIIPPGQVQGGCYSIELAR